jgi:Protein of unknown function (DUF3142)
MPAVNRRTQLASAILVLAISTCLALIAGARGLRGVKRTSPPPPARLAALPKLVFWAWERPEDLRFLAPDRAAVAFLAKTITLSTKTGAFSVHTRLQPLRIAPGTPLIAVVRIEDLPHRTSEASAFPPSPELRVQLASQIASLQSISGVRGIQIDFDATASERDFYSALLQDVRRQLRPDLPLSITSLASWCIGDSWLNSVPAGTIDEAVPMLFRMGVDSANVANFLRSNQSFRVNACNASLGLSTDEPFSRSILTGESPIAFGSRAEKRIYVFAPHAWTEREANSILQEHHP